MRGQYQTKILIYGKIEDISKAIGKQNRAILGITESGFAKQIEKIINGGEANG